MPERGGCVHSDMWRRTRMTPTLRWLWCTNDFQGGVELKEDPRIVVQGREEEEGERLHTAVESWADQVRLFVITTVFSESIHCEFRKLVKSVMQTQDRCRCTGKMKSSSLRQGKCEFEKLMMWICHSMICYFSLIKTLLTLFAYFCISAFNDKNVRMYDVEWKWSGVVTGMT